MLRANFRVTYLIIRAVLWGYNITIQANTVFMCSWITRVDIFVLYYHVLRQEKRLGLHLPPREHFLGLLKKAKSQV